MRLSGLIIITNRNGKSASPWKMPHWIFASAKVFLSVVNSTYQFFMKSVMNFMTLSDFSYISKHSTILDCGTVSCVFYYYYYYYWQAYFSQPNSIPISWLNILTSCIRVSNSFSFLQAVIIIIIIIGLFVMPSWTFPIFTISSRQPLKEKNIRKEHIRL